LHVLNTDVPRENNFKNNSEQENSILEDF